MIDIYEYFDICRDLGMSGEEALRQYERDVAEYGEHLIEDLEERQLHTEYQQDLIDLHRFER